MIEKKQHRHFGARLRPQLTAPLHLPARDYIDLNQE
jgi:hypothetical protein